MITINDFEKIDHPSGKKYKAYQVKGTDIKLLENGRMLKSKNGHYEYKPSGFFTFSRNGMGLGDFAHDYCFGPSQKAVDLYNSLFTD